MSDSIALNNMIKQQLRTNNIVNNTIVELYNEIPREDFVPSCYQKFAYSDLPIPLAHSQQMLTPLEEAQILQGLDLKGHETILEVGTGSGFLTAMLSRLCKKVISIDYYADFKNLAYKKLNQYNFNNVELLVADGSQGYPDLAPYDAIVFTGALPSLTKIHRLQVIPGGKLFAILGSKPIMQAQLFHVDHQEQWHNKLLFETNTPFLIDKTRQKPFVF